MSQSYNLISKNASTVQALAKYFITIEPDSRILTVSEFETLIDAARGTIQNSLKLLSHAEAITLKSRGHLGTFLIEKDLTKLLNFAEISFLVGAMPLPYSKLYEGLSTGLIQTMENKLNIPVNLAHMRGAHQRIQMVLNGRYDFAVVSKYAALQYLDAYEDIDIVIEFSENSYLHNHVLMFSDPKHTEIEKGMRVAIDYDSIDQSALTLEATKGIDVELVPISYNQFVEKLNNKEIDAAIWNGDEITNKFKIDSIKNLNLNNSDNTIAVIIIDKERLELKNLITQLIDVDEVMNIQKSVLDGTMIPSY